MDVINRSPIFCRHLSDHKTSWSDRRRRFGFYLNVQPFLGPLDPAVEAVHVGGVGDAEYVLEDPAPAEQDVLPFPAAEHAIPASLGDGRVVEVLAGVFGRLGS